jgi:hypothetical protein
MYIANNLVEDVTNEEWGTCGMSIGMVRDFTIEHNEIRDVSYSGIAVGWGWTRDITCMRNNLIRKNHIHHFAKHMYDVGGIYTLSAQPGTIIEENYIHDLLPAPYAHDKEHYQYIYLDEGSWYMIVRNNYCEKAKFKENNKISRNVWENNGPQVSQDVIKNAGIQSEYKDILDNK